MGPNFRYWGFLSYSHDDRQAAERLHRALEAYRIPPRLVGLDGPFGPVPARLLPIFRDRDELNAGGKLGPAVETALARSRSLIVLCSPRAAASAWVDAEIAAFEALHPDGPLFCVVVAGHPLAPAGAQGDAAECLPPTARKRFSSKPGVQESAPIAVDLRSGGDGWRLAIHKIVAGLTGLPLDQLVQRDAQRRHRRLAWLAAALAGTAIALGAMAVMAYRARDEARLQRAQAEGLVEFMLVDLRKRLEPAGRLDALDAVGERALHYYGQQSPSSLDLDALGRRARALHLIGEVSDRRGDVQAARKAFATARNSTAELLARAPGHPQRLYDHAQSVYWSGYIDWQYGDAGNAEKAFEEYARLSRRLSALDPGNPEWLAEVGYAHSNLGVLLLEQSLTARAIPQFQESLRINRRRAALPGDQALVQLDIGQDRAWLSTAYFANRRLREAIAERHAEIEIYARLLARSPDDAQVKDRVMWAHTALAELYLSAADFPQARRQLQLSTALAGELRTLDSDNVSWKQSMAKSKVLSSELHRRTGKPEAALANLEVAKQLIDAQLAQDSETAVWRIELQEAAAMEQVALSLRSHDTQQAERLLQASQQRLQEVSLDAPSAGRGLRFQILGMAAQADLAKVRDDPRGRQQALLRLAQLGEKNLERLDGESAALLAAAWRELGRGREAGRLAGQLTDLGYGHEALHPGSKRSSQITSFDPGGSQ